MSRAQTQTLQLTDQQLANVNAQNQQFLNQQQQLGNTISSQYQSISEQSGPQPRAASCRYVAIAGRNRQLFRFLAAIRGEPRGRHQQFRRLQRTDRRAGASEGHCGRESGAAKSALLRQYRLSTADVRSAGSFRPLRRGLQPSRQNAWHSFAVAKRERQCFSAQRRVLYLAGFWPGLHVRRSAEHSFLVSLNLAEFKGNRRERERAA